MGKRVTHLTHPDTTVGQANVCMWIGGWKTACNKRVAGKYITDSVPAATCKRCLKVAKELGAL